MQSQQEQEANGQCLSSPYCSLLLLSCSVAFVCLGLALVHPAINGDRGCLNFIANKRKREEESRLRAEVDEYHARRAAIQAEADTAARATEAHWQQKISLSSSRFQELNKKRSETEASIAAHQEALRAITLPSVQATLTGHVTLLNQTLAAVIEQCTAAKADVSRAQNSKEASLAKTKSQMQLALAELTGISCEITEDDEESTPLQQRINRRRVVEAHNDV